ncbi:MAG: RIP metalloprotease RseP [Candidatus Aminicenantes bacterium]|jgi:regulator of sigma E protease
MNVLYSILSFAIVLGIIVIVHELGHYIAARLMGVRVEVFSFGFGLRLFGKKVGETDFRLSLIPLGGYVKMAGEEEYDPNDLKPYEFHAKNRGQKIFILVMGPAMNVLLAFLIFTIINITGVEMPIYRTYPPQIGYVEIGSPAEKAGIQKGDIIRTVEGRSIKNWEELEIIIGANANQKLPIEYERDGQLMKTEMELRSFSRHNIGDAGIHWDFKTQIKAVTEDSPALHAGLKVNDILLAVNSNPIGYFEIVPVISQSAEKPLQFRVRRGENEFDMEIIPEKVYFLETQPLETIEEAQEKLKEIKEKVKDLDFNITLREGKFKILSETMDTAPDPETYQATTLLTPGEKGIIGIEMAPYSPTIEKRYGFFAAMGHSVNKMIGLVDLVFNAIRKMIVGKLSPKSLSGPIEIASFSQRALESGASSFFLLIAFISLQLGLINLLPIPALDGGHLMIFSIESVIRRDFSPKVKNILMNIGFFILIGLMVFIILNDIAKNLPNGWNSLFPF